MDLEFTEPTTEVEAGETEQADQDVTPNTGDDDGEDAPQAPAEAGWGADSAASDE